MEYNELVYKVDIATVDGGVEAEINLILPPQCSSIVVLLDGTGQGVFNETNRFLSQALLQEGFGTCVKSLSSLRERSEIFKPSKQPRFEVIGVLYGDIIRFLRDHADLAAPRLFLLASGDAAASALYSVASSSAALSAMVISGGRLSVALPLAAKNTLPTLFLLGSEDTIGAASCRAAFAATRGEKALSIINGAFHLLREPGSVEEVAKRSAEWFRKWV